LRRNRFAFRDFAPCNPSSAPGKGLLPLDIPQILVVGTLGGLLFFCSCLLQATGGVAGSNCLGWANPAVAKLRNLPPPAGTS
jgi:hypothetical protein